MLECGSGEDENGVVAEGAACLQACEHLVGAGDHTQQQQGSKEREERSGPGRGWAPCRAPPAALALQKSPNFSLPK